MLRELVLATIFVLKRFIVKWKSICVFVSVIVHGYDSESDLKEFSTITEFSS
jgi:hypothetical protein